MLIVSDNPWLPSKEKTLVGQFIYFEYTRQSGMCIIYICQYFSLTSVSGPTENPTTFPSSVTFNSSVLDQSVMFWL